MHGAGGTLGAMQRIDLSGKRFGRLLAIEYLPAAARWRCVCDCGREHLVTSALLRDGRAQSCGCLRRELTTARATRHGLHGSKAYQAWNHLRQRCDNPSVHNFARYGGRGISYDPRWRDFTAFLEDMGEPPDPSYSIDRIDNDGPYCKSNCRWASPVEQARNRTNGVVFVVDGQQLTVAELSAKTGIPRNTLLMRRHRGWPDERVAAPVRRRTS